MRFVLRQAYKGQARNFEGRHAVCHSGFEEKLTGAFVDEDEVVTDGTIITSRGMGTAIPFALAIVKYLKGEDAVAEDQKGACLSGINDEARLVCSYVRNQRCAL